MQDEEQAKKMPIYELGQGLSALSVEEIDRIISTLQDEIKRLENARNTKQSSKAAAEAFFRK